MIKHCLILITLFSSASIAAIKSLPTDPTTPKVALSQESDSNAKQKKLSSRWQLQAVNISDEYKNAIISGQLVSEGQELTSGVFVSAIEPHAVTIDNKGNVQTLSMEIIEIKQELDNSNEN